MTEAKRKTTTAHKEKASDKEESVKMKGKYINTVGKRKTSSAQVRLYKTGAGNIVINGEKGSKYFDADLLSLATQALKLAGQAKDLDISIVVRGGGKKGQAVAVRHGIARALVELDKDLRPAMKAKDLLTRDDRKKERKKPGLKKARRAPQWAKR